MVVVLAFGKTRKSRRRKVINYDKWKPNRLSVPDSPWEGLIKHMVASLSETLFKTFDSWNGSKTFSSLLMKTVSFSQGTKARFMQKALLNNSRCEYSSVTSFYPRQAALSAAKTISTVGVAMVFYGFAKIFEVLPDQEERGSTAADLINLYIKVTQLEKLENERKGFSVLAKQISNRVLKPDRSSIGDSPVEGIRKCMVAVFTESSFWVLDKACSHNKIFSSVIVKLASYNQNTKAKIMKRLLLGRHCGYSLQVSYYPRLVALSVAHVSSSVVTVGVFYCIAEVFEILLTCKRARRGLVSSRTH